VPAVLPCGSAAIRSKKDTPDGSNRTAMSSYHKIMAACDLSPHAVQVLKHAARLSLRLDSELLIVKIIDQKEIDSVKAYFSKISEARENTTLDDYLKEMKKERTIDIQNLMRSIPRKDLKYKILIRVGRPHQELMKVINEKDVDLVIMGTRAKKNFRGFLFGATAEKMFRMCPVPLLRIRLN
jgi:nucleotide-binding universal stress UspA family protein